MEAYLRKYWSSHFQYNWKLGVFLILLFGIPRFIIVLQSYIDRSYGVVMFVFLSMWLVPFILLTKDGRRNIGIRRPSHWWRIVLSFIAGGLICYIIFSIFFVLFQTSIENAFVYIGGNNPGSSVIGSEKSIYFCIAVIPSMIFSPIGEEFLYRGIIHGSFVPKFGETKASIFDSLAFAITHIAHFGIIYMSGIWHFLPVPTLLWVLSMFITSQVFFRCKLYSNSIWGAVAAHSGFNFIMMYGIFYLL